MTQVILVDNKDKEIGQEEKLRAHQLGLLHRCFSIFVLNDRSELMLQKRAINKYHSGGLWSNTVCSHPRPAEPIEQAIHKRLKEEMGFDCDLNKAFTFTYKVKFDNGLFENEIDHVYYGIYNKKPVLNPEEAEDWKWADLNELEKDIEQNPEKYTYWLRKCFYRFKNYYLKHQENKKRK